MPWRIFVAQPIQPDRQSRPVVKVLLIPNKPELPFQAIYARLIRLIAIALALVIMSYILCGFAHIPAVGIFVGGFVSLIPTRRKDLTELGWKALWAASLATAMIGCVAGVFFSGDADRKSVV